MLRDNEFLSIRIGGQVTVALDRVMFDKLYPPRIVLALTSMVGGKKFATMFTFDINSWYIRVAKDQRPYDLFSIIKELQYKLDIAIWQFFNK